VSAFSHRRESREGVGIPWLTTCAAGMPCIDACATSSTGTPCHLTVVGFGGADELKGEPGVLAEDMVDAVEERRLEVAQAERVLLHQHHGAPDPALQHRGRRAASRWSKACSTAKRGVTERRGAMPRSQGERRAGRRPRQMEHVSCPFCKCKEGK